MATPTAGTKLSLGKLGRATAVDNSDYTSKTSLNSCARDSSTGKASLGDFYISAVVNELTGYGWVDEQTNETYELTFTNANSLFASRIAARADNFTWTTSNASLFNMSGTEDVTTQYNAGAIADASTPSTFESTLVTDGEFENWSGANLDSWTESGTISEQTGATGSAVRFQSNGAYVEQSFTAKSNSVYEIRVLGKFPVQESNVTLVISGSTGGEVDFGYVIGGSFNEWNTFRHDFYTSGSANQNVTVKLKFTATVSGTDYPLIDTVKFRKWEGANIGDTNVTITGTYHDDGQSTGFNDHADFYDTAISKVVEIQDTYAGQAIACFLPGTMISMADGTKKDIEDVNVGDEVLSVIIPNLPDEDLGYNEWKTFESSDDMTNLEVSSATVEHIFYDYMDGYYSINNGLIKVTAEHDFWTFTGEKWKWYNSKQLSVGDRLLDYEGNLISISSIENIIGEVEVVNFDVEPLDIYFAGRVLVHNKGANSEP